jgi:hypothetical protein
MTKNQESVAPMYCFVNHVANIGNVIFSSDHELYHVMDVRKDCVLAKPLTNNHNEIYISSYKVIARVELIKPQVVNVYDTFLVPDFPYPFDMLYFVEFKDYMGKYKCTNLEKEIWGIDEDIVLSYACNYTKKLSEMDILELKRIISEW